MSKRGEPKFIDVHCHIHDEAFDYDRAKVIERALKSGVEVIITSTLNMNDLKKALEIAEKHECIRIAAGFDPLNLSMDDAESLAREVRRLKNKIIAIGEVGLDYFYVKGQDREKQIEIFRFWINIASELKLPVVVHSRSAGKYAIEILMQEGYDKVLMHAFDGSSGWAMKGVSKGFFFSIPPSVVRSQQKMKLVKAVPPDFLMVESDAPVLAPTQGERNEPSNVVVAATKIAEIKRMDVLETFDILYLNSKSFFKL
ncbi:MAG: TatD family hydrolase [Candidatus Nezhaarchaeales archaeon]